MTERDLLHYFESEGYQPDASELSALMALFQTLGLPVLEHEGLWMLIGALLRAGWTVPAQPTMGHGAIRLDHEDWSENQQGSIYVGDGEYMHVAATGRTDGPRWHFESVWKVEPHDTVTGYGAEGGDNGTLYRDTALWTLLETIRDKKCNGTWTEQGAS